jgi:hypothetical protein
VTPERTTGPLALTAIPSSGSPTRLVTVSSTEVRDWPAGLLGAGAGVWMGGWLGVGAGADGLAGGWVWAPATIGRAMRAAVAKVRAVMG